MSKTHVPLEFSELLRSAGSLVSSIPPDSVAALLDASATGLEGRVDSLRALAESGDKLTAALATRTSALDRLAANGTALTHVVADHSGSLGQSLTDLRNLADSLRQAKGDTAILLDRGSQLLTQVADVVAHQKGNLDCDLKTLELVTDETTTVARQAGLRALLRVGPVAFSGVGRPRRRHDRPLARCVDTRRLRGQPGVQQPAAVRTAQDAAGGSGRPAVQLAAGLRPPHGLPPGPHQLRAFSALPTGGVGLVAGAAARRRRRRVRTPPDQPAPVSDSESEGSASDPIPPPPVVVDPEPEPPAQPDPEPPVGPDPPPEAAAPEGEEAPRPPRRTRLVAGIIAVAVVVTVVGAFAATRYADVNRQLADVRDARRVAGSFGAAALTWDYRDFKPYESRIKALAAGTFKRQFTDAQGGLESLLGTVQSQSEGTVKQIYVGEPDGRSVSALVVVDQRAQVKDGAPQTATSYLELSLVKQGSHWLVDGVCNLEFGGSALPGQLGSTSGPTTTTVPPK